MSSKLYDFINYPINKFVNSHEFKASLAKVLCCTNAGGSGIQSIVAGTNITIDNTDPLNPIISASGGGGLTGTGTNNTLAKWTGATSLGNSLVSEDNTTVKIGAVGTEPTFAFGVYGTTNGAVITGVQKSLSLYTSNTSTVSALTVSRSNTSANIADFEAAGGVLVSVTSTGTLRASALAGTGTRMVVADTNGLLSTQAIPSGAGTVASVSDINTGTDNTNYVSSLGLEGSKYTEQDNTKLYAITTGTAAAYVLTTTPSFTPITGTILYVRFHLANTGAATINVNGSGAVALQKDLSTALVANDIPINSEYQLLRTSTGWLIKDIGFAGISTSARLAASLSDETGSGVAVFGTSPSFTTSVLGGATFAAFNTVTTNLSLGGAATTMTVGGTPITAITHTYSGNATATGVTKTLNIGTGGNSGSTTEITLGSSTSGATNNIRLNTTPASDATGDIYYRNASGFIQRLGIGSTGQVLTVASGLPTWAAAGGGGGVDTSAWHKGGDAVTVASNFGTTTNFDLPFIANSTEYGRLYKNGAWSFGETASATSSGAAAIGYGAAAGALYSTSIGIFSQTNEIRNTGAWRVATLGVRDSID